ncbi:MAG: hypothetical protein OES20_10375 [Gammaproteobacteria bacterium]|nr:hypothetical protein [Gammaproteobacteria bacterium]MDH3857003.1 hypothetical protein [Gammaproteobacteria bacterium]
MAGQSKAWIAFGFQSGMSRFDVTRYLSDNESFVITDGLQQTYAGPEDNKSKYILIYCSKPQKLYLMQFKLADSRAVFVETKKKFEKRYGKPRQLYSESDYWETENWENVSVSFIWDLNESETIALEHRDNNSIAEFQDFSVCK